MTLTYCAYLVFYIMLDFAEKHDMFTKVYINEFHDRVHLSYMQIFQVSRLFGSAFQQRRDPHPPQYVVDDAWHVDSNYGDRGLRFLLA